MGGVVQFIRSLALVAFLLGVTGSIVDVTRLVMNEAVHAHKPGGMSFKKMNSSLVGK